MIDAFQAPGSVPREQGAGARQVNRVLVVTNMWPTDAAPMGGIFVAEQVASLRALGLEVDVLFIDGILGGWGAYLAGFRRVGTALGQGKYDLIHAHYVFTGLVALMGRLLARQTEVPIVLTQHGIETQVGWTAPLSRWTSRRVDATIATSRRVACALGPAPNGPHKQLAANSSQSEPLQSVGSLNGRVLAIIPCGVDTTLFRPMNRAEARAALNLPQDAALVLFAGMRRPEKRLDLIEAAVAAVQKRRPDAQLLLAESVQHDCMPLYMNAANVLVLASEAEGSPMVVKEALACDLPVVSVDVGDVAGVIGKIAGCYVVERSVEGLARGLLASLPQQGSSTGKLAGRTHIEKLSLSSIATQIALLYETVALAGGRSRARL